MPSLSYLYRLKGSMQKAKAGRLYGVKALKEWSRQSVSGYPGVKISNMSSDWRDGRAFCALLHRYRPDLVDYTNLDHSDWTRSRLCGSIINFYIIFRNCQLAFDVAEKELNVPALLDAEDVVAYDNPDPLSIMTYVSMLYHRLSPHRHSLGAVRSLM